MPPQPISAIWILSLADVLGALLAPASSGSPALAAAVVKNSRREVTLYFLSDELDEVVVEALELPFELSDVELLPPESFDELELSFFSEDPLSEEPLSEDPFSDEPFSEEPFSEEPSPSFLPPPLPGLLLPPLA